MFSVLYGRHSYIVLEVINIKVTHFVLWGNWVELKKLFVIVFIGRTKVLLKRFGLGQDMD